jgi:alpha-L-arabinofuranosidase
MERRSLLKAAAGSTAAALLFGKSTALGQQADSQIEVLLNEPIGTIAPEIYGHFTEHMGAVIYDGVWVGENSSVPNQCGIRSALIEKMRVIRAPVIRWPGGCFADSYNWRDGIGPKDKRPRETNFWWGSFSRELRAQNKPQIYDPNSFGTDEFLRFCELCGAQGYIAANLRSIPSIEFARWVEYVNSPAGLTTLAETRAAAGHPKPYNVRYWGVGNESWGCGGNFEPEDYASEFRRFTAWVPDFDVPLCFVASGAGDDNLDWTQRFFQKIYHGQPSEDSHGLWGLSLHYYTWNLSHGKTHDWNQAKGDALQFNEVDWYEVLIQADKMEEIIRHHWNAMGQYDLLHKVKLVVDEYGPWYKPGTQISDVAAVGQQVTIRDALATALTLDTFNRNAEKVSMAACAQLINGINALFLAHEDKFCVTPDFYVFEMYAAHQGGTAVRAEFSAPSVYYKRDGKPASFWGLRGSASLKGKILTVTVVNPDLHAPRETEVVLRGGEASVAKAWILTDNDMHAHNTFEQPDRVKKHMAEVTVLRNTVRFTVPPACVGKLEVQLS